MSRNFSREGKAVVLLAIGLLLGLAAPIAWLIVAQPDPTQSPDNAGAYQGTALNGLAADFQLVDQTGVTVALSDFRGQVVALTFMDSQCTDTCPLTAAHLLRVHQTLGDEAGSVVFIGVNVNLQANTVTEVMLTTSRWRLTEIPTWHFLTGSAEELAQVWKAYDVTALPDPAGGPGILHTPGVFLIDQVGQKRWYVSTPFDETGGSQVSPPLNELLVKHIDELLNEN